MVDVSKDIPEIRWLHFSDIHFNFNDYDTEIMRTRLKEYIQRLSLQKQDFLFITGDFRFAPKKSFLGETKIYVEEIMKMIPQNNLQMCFAIGNHDLNRTKGRENLIESLKKEYLSSNGELSDYYLDHLETDFKDFVDFVKDWEKDLFPNRNPHRMICTEKANILCLNTAIISGRRSEDEYGQLILGIKSLRECLKQGKKGKLTIACGHHSLESLTFDERLRVIELFQHYDIHIYLCGHNHNFFVNNISDEEDYKLYEIFAGNFYTENRSSQCGFVEGCLQGSNLKLRCHEWDFNFRKWHLSNVYSKRGDGTEKNFNIRAIDKRMDSIYNEMAVTSMEPENIIWIPGDKVTGVDYASSDVRESEDCINILHLSDLQFGITKELSGKDKVAIQHRKVILEDKLIDFLKTKIPEKWRPDIVVASGDLAWSATKDDYAKFGVWMKKLLAVLGLSSDRVILCTGNHDINSNAAKRNSKGKGVTSEQAHQELYGDIDKLNLYENFREYIDFCKGVIDPEISITPLKNIVTEKPDVKYLYGFRDLLGIRFNVLNTSWYCGERRLEKDSGGDKEKLWIGKDFVRDLQHNLIHNEKFSITVFHHPFDWLHPEEGDDDADIKNWLLKLSDIILCGHVHTRVGEPTFEHNRAQIFQSGALWRDKEYVYESRIVQINKKTGQVRQITLEYDNSNDDWKYRERKGPNLNSSYSINYNQHMPGMFEPIIT